MTNLDRLLTLHYFVTEENADTEEYDSLKKQIQEAIDKAEKWDQYCQIHDYSPALEFMEIFTMANQNKEIVERLKNHKFNSMQDQIWVQSILKGEKE